MRAHRTVLTVLSKTVSRKTSRSSTAQNSHPCRSSENKKEQHEQWLLRLSYTLYSSFLDAAEPVIADLM
ncbi:MAG: hypothetical protein JWM78_1846 [Verrucomicrobiaceae bacterium]|nr:hypothetical protein [Verrucomicrobiaceae bacterium]